MYSFLSYYADHIGIVGVVLTLLAYYGLNVNKLKSDSMLYLMLNLIGSSLLMLSLLFHWNLSSVLIEIAWISISLIGIYRVIYPRNKNQIAKIYLINEPVNSKTFNQNSHHA